MNVLVIGGGGREHTIVWKLAQSPKVKKLYAIPGGPGMMGLAECVPMDVTNLEGLAQWAETHAIDLTVVGPEAPLVAGLVDVFEAHGLKAFGPKAKAAEIEGSKIFSKELMEKYHVPTAFFKVCDSLDEAKAYVREKGAPIVIKADGLAAGKGVVVAMTEKEALEALEEMMGQEHRFGSAGSRVVIEEFMEGEECSLLCFTDGKTIVPMIPAQDHKRVFDGDKGPNTGGMGAYAPAPVMTEALKQKTLDTIIRPVIDALEKEGRPYSGCLYAGLMISGDSIKVVEFNCRFGDPETQPIMLRMKSDLVELCLAACEGKLDEKTSEWDERASLGVVMAAGGYPGDYRTGDVIHGLPLEEVADGKVFHAGTKLADDEQVVTSGGRVLCVTALGHTVAEAQKRAYALMTDIHWDDCFCRKDIGWRAIEREQN